jgi:hypothetical protein
MAKNFGQVTGALWTSVSTFFLRREGRNACLSETSNINEAKEFTSFAHLCLPSLNKTEEDLANTKLNRNLYQIPVK